jgi:hypothetical protein
MIKDLPDLKKLNTKRVLNIYKAFRDRLRRLKCLRRNWDMDELDPDITQLELQKALLKVELDGREHIPK